MGQTLIEKEADFAKFKAVFGEVAPEFTNPLIFNPPGGDRKEIPYIMTKLGKSDREYEGVKATFEAKEEDTGSVSRIVYDSHYGLKLRKSLYLYTDKYKPGENAIINGEVTYTANGLIAILSASYSSIALLDPILAGHQLSRPQDFRVHIGVLNEANSTDSPPLAWMEYNPGTRIPINADFPLTDFESARESRYDIRREKYMNRYHYERVYFQWENLVGVKIGRAKFKDKGTDQEYKKWLANINQQEWTQIGDTCYKGKMTHSSDNRRGFGTGRLRFHRKDADGELWKFSVPDWMNKEDFLRDLQDDSMEDFLYQYPVIFWVKQNGQEIQGVATWNRRDLPH